MLSNKCNCNCYELDNSCQCQEYCEGYSYYCQEIDRKDNIWVDWGECCECDTLCDCYCNSDNNCDCEYLHDYGCNCGDCGDYGCVDCGDCGDYYYECGDEHCECYIYCHLGEEIFACQCECDYTCEGCDVK